MKQVLITEDGLDELVGNANTKLTNYLVKKDSIDEITALKFTIHLATVMSEVCKHLFYEEKKDV